MPKRVLTKPLAECRWKSISAGNRFMHYFIMTADSNERFVARCASRDIARRLVNLHNNSLPTKEETQDAPNN